MSHAVQFTISALTGAYAQKYSVVLTDAERFEALFARFKAADLADFCADGPERRYDPFVAFGRLMKVLKKLARHGAEPFCKAIERASDGKTALRFDIDDGGERVALLACGRTGICRCEGVEKTFESIELGGETYRAQIATLGDVFKNDLMNLMNICEETIAKNAMLIAKTVDNSTPVPARLVQTQG